MMAPAVFDFQSNQNGLNDPKGNKKNGEVIGTAPHDTNTSYAAAVNVLILRLRQQGNEITFKIKALTCWRVD